MEGLEPGAVSVVDLPGNLLTVPGTPRRGRAEAPDAMIEFRRRSSGTCWPGHATLEPLLGAEKFRAGVYVDCDFTGASKRRDI